MEPYSLDLRERVAAACDEGVDTHVEIAEAFGVSPSFIRKLLARRRTTGTLAAKPHAGGFASAVDQRAQRVLTDLVRTQPDATLAELAEGLAARTGVRVSRSVVCRVLQQLGWSRKKRCSRRPSGTPRGSGACGRPSPASCGRHPWISGWWSMKAGPPPA